jgi:Cu(I)/Ag(I) efflux system membrane protein CusA/SilA
MPDYTNWTPEQRSPLGRVLRWCLENKLIVALGLLLMVGWGLTVAPFDWKLGGAPRDPVPIDAIPDIGENQQIVFTRWPGRSPQDVQDQISTPLAAALQGIRGVKTIRSLSMFGFSTIYLIFEEGMDFYDSRTRILEKLGSLRPGRDYPVGATPELGPDATALGQIFWYTLEGRDPEGEPIGGWDLEELRTIQDWNVRYALRSAGGVSEVASVGGFVREYQVDVDPDAMRVHGVTLGEITAAVRKSNVDVGAKTIEMNNVEYFVRGIGFVKKVEDIANAVVKVRDNVPILIEHVATVKLGPALRRGVLDKDGAEAVGGVVVARYGDNPLAVIKNVKEKIERIAPGLDTKVVIADGTARERIEAYAATNGFDAYLQGGEMLDTDAWLKHLRATPRDRWPHWVNTSQVTIVPFYDRTGLIYETLGTLRIALVEEALITFIVVVLMVFHLRSSVLIGSMLPLAVLLCFIAMKLFGVDANIVALSGIAIAIGTIVDMGIVLTENVLRHLNEAPPEAPRLDVVHRAASEVGGAILTAVATTVISFLPVFVMRGQEGKLFRPLAFTKTFVLIASIIVALTVLPAGAHLLLCAKRRRRPRRGLMFLLVAAAGLVLLGYGAYRDSLPILGCGVFAVLYGLSRLAAARIPESIKRFGGPAICVGIVIIVGLLLSAYWKPLGIEPGLWRNFAFVALTVGLLLGGFKLFQWAYPWLLRRMLAHKVAFISFIALIVLSGVVAWRGLELFAGPIPEHLRAEDLTQEQYEDLPWADRYRYDAARLQQRQWGESGPLGPPIGDEPIDVRLRWTLARSWGGLDRQFMPDLDEGSFLYMPTTMTHASIGEATDILAKQDRAFRDIPEVDSVVGKVGRAETALDPAPISMIETVINYKSRYKKASDGRHLRFRPARDDEPFTTDEAGGRFAVDEQGELIEDPDGLPFRQWRPHIESPDDIWQEIVAAGKIPGTTSAPKLMPINARLVMLQSGMRAPMGVKIKGGDLETIEQVALRIEQLLKEVPGVEPSAVIADRIVGKPYLHIVPDRRAIARYGVNIRDFQDIVEVAIGGRAETQTVEGLKRFDIRVRYQRELRDRIDTMKKILVAGSDGAQIPLEELAEIEYVRGPQVIKSEDTFLVGYVLFDKKPNAAEVEVVQRAQDYLDRMREAGKLTIPPGVSYEFAGNYENQVRSQRTLMIVLPVALGLIFLILYLQFHRVTTTLLVFSGIFVAWSGGFLLLWLYGQPWFLDFTAFGVNMRDLFQVRPLNLTVAVWVGFLALFGIATDDGVVQGTYLTQSFRRRRPSSVAGVRDATVAAARRRIRPCLMTSATTILALIPVLTSSGRGSDVMIPMAIPSFGGMLLVLLSVFVVPVLYCWIEEIKLRRSDAEAA